MRDTHLQSRHGIGGDQAVGKDPAYDLMRERVRQEMQVGHALIGVDIGDVGHPQLVDPVDGQSLDHVLVLPVRMVGACRVTALLGLQHQV